MTHETRDLETRDLKTADLETATPASRPAHKNPAQLAEVLEDANAAFKQDHVTCGVLCITAGYGVGIHATGGLEGVAAIAAELLESYDRDEAFLLQVDDVFYFVTPTGTYWPCPVDVDTSAFPV